MSSPSQVATHVLSPSRHLELVSSEVAKLAADLILKSVGSAAAAGTKTSLTDVVTHTDLEAERLIRSELMQRCPGSNIVGEEYGEEIGHSGIGWIVDPIDGTVNFLYDLPVISVSIAATLDGEVVAGAVHDVIRNESFSAARNEGARRNGQPIRASAVSSLDRALVGTGFSYDSKVRALEAEVVAGLLPQCRDIRCMGSAALNLCWVASGRLDGFYERDIKIYDYSAGALIAAEAGATVELPHANKLDLTLAATPGVFAPLRAEVTRVL